MPTWRLKLLYDGECPFCRGEVEWLKRRDRAGHLATEDIAALGFDPARYGLSRDEVMSMLHAVRVDGTVVKGMDAVREAYRSVGLGWLLWPTRLPVLRTVSDCLYRLFAKRRVRWGRLLGRGCSDGRCGIRPRGTRTANPARPARPGRNYTPEEMDAK
jgi:predicted DCC family thiol-disulfide oxidoreductase YuxK